MYLIERDVKIESELKASHETRSGSLVRDKYVIVLNYNGVVVTHVSKSISKTTHFIGNPEEICS